MKEEGGRFRSKEHIRRSKYSALCVSVVYVWMLRVKWSVYQSLCTALFFLLNTQRVTFCRQKQQKQQQHWFGEWIRTAWLQKSYSIRGRSDHHQAGGILLFEAKILSLLSSSWGKKEEEVAAGKKERRYQIASHRLTFAHPVVNVNE